MDEQLWDGWQELLRHYIRAPGIVRYWELRSQLFSARFRKFAAQLEPVRDRRTVAILLPEEKLPD
jgi:protein-disulfide isomerase